MKKIYEDDGGVGPSGVTQVASVDGGKVDTFGSYKNKDKDEFYKELLELDDYNKKLTEDNTKFAGTAGGLLSQFKKYVNDPEFFSKSDINLYKILIDVIESRFNADDSITITKTKTGYKIILNLNIK